MAYLDFAINTAVAPSLDCLAAAVGKWQPLFVECRLNGLWDEPRRGRRPTITAGQVEDVLVATM